MAKKITLITAWNWLMNIIDSQGLSSSEQLVMIHMLKLINRNFWKPVQVTMPALSRNTGKDHRTVKKAFSMLLAKKLIIEKQGGYYIGIDEYAFDSLAAIKPAGTAGFISNTAKAKTESRRTLGDFN